MKRILALAALALSVCAVAGAGVARAQGAVVTAQPDSPAQCSSYTTGADTHTACMPPVFASPGAGIACRNYTVGADTQAECAPVARPGLGGLRAIKALSIPPAFPLHCYTYRIGSSTYIDCR